MLSRTRSQQNDSTPINKPRSAYKLAHASPFSRSVFLNGVLTINNLRVARLIIKSKALPPVSPLSIPHIRVTLATENLSPQSVNLEERQFSVQIFVSSGRLPGS